MSPLPLEAGEQDAKLLAEAAVSSNGGTEKSVADGCQTGKRLTAK
jgi:hypothetical protein